MRGTGRSNRLSNTKSWPTSASLCDDGKEHDWRPVSFVFETQLLDGEGRVQIRQPDIEKGRVYCVCTRCWTHTYAETEWAGYYLGGPPSRCAFCNHTVHEPGRCESCDCKAEDG